MADYSYQAHMDWLTEWMLALDLRDITLVCQDWGSLLGLRLAAEHPDRFARIVVANGFLPTPTVPPTARSSSGGPLPCAPPCCRSAGSSTPGSRAR